MPEDKVGEAEPCPGDRTGQNGEGEVVVDAEIKSFDNSAAETDNNRREDLSDESEVENLPQVASAVPEANRDEEASDGGREESSQRLAGCKRQLPDAGEVRRERRSVTAPKTTDRGRGSVRPRQTVRVSVMNPRASTPPASTPTTLT
jgi:hypothetical protein